MVDYLCEVVFVGILFISAFIPSYFDFVNSHFQFATLHIQFTIAHLGEQSSVFDYIILEHTVLAQLNNKTPSFDPIILCTHLQGIPKGLIVY